MAHQRLRFALGLLLALLIIAVGAYLGLRSLPGGALVRANPRDSLFHKPFDPGASRSEEGAEAARLLQVYLETGDSDALRQASAVYERIIPLENFGGEYGTLHWFCRYTLEDPAGRRSMIENADGARFLRYVSPGDYQLLREYLRVKYGQGGDAENPDFRFVDELIRFNSPERAAWDATDEILALLHLHEGQAIADIGAGPGFFSFRFAELVGETGRVYASELNERDVAYLQQVAAEDGLLNLSAQVTRPTDVGLPDDSVDLAFMASTYQAVYAFNEDPDRDAFITSLHRALRSDGLLVVVENEPEVHEGLPYRGTGIAAELVIAHLESWGFRLVDERRFIPQRYVLVFEER